MAVQTAVLSSGETRRENFGKPLKDNSGYAFESKLEDCQNMSIIDKLRVFDISEAVSFSYE
jgi:hypothetical protein